jgi:hypothetical protein
MNRLTLWALLLGWGMVCGVEVCRPQHAHPHPVASATEPATWQDLHNALRQAGVPYAQLFTRIAIVETGWDFRSGVGAAHNLFGMQARPGYASTLNGYAVYHSRRQCIQDLAAWVFYDPPRPGEPGLHFLHRRGWNPFSSYYVYLQQVNPWALTPEQQHLLAVAYTPPATAPAKSSVVQPPALLATNATPQATTRVQASGTVANWAVELAQEAVLRNLLR